ncbi:MAG: rod shape-determining protein MreC, partial [Actinomycetota bacterium]
MAIYSVGRRRIIVVLLLSSVLLLTLDLRGNAVLDRIRDAAAVAMTPVETAVDVVTSPVERAWESYREFDDLERENAALRERLARIEGSEAAAVAAVVDAQKIRDLNELPSLAGIPTSVAEVVGESANNLDQIIEINKGSLDGVRTGQPVVNQAGLVGRITTVTPTSAQVMLVTDRRFTIAVEILGGTGAAGDPFVPVDTTLSGLTPDELDAVTADPAAAETDPAGTDTAGTDTAGTDTAGTDTASTDTASTDTDAPPTTSRARPHSATVVMPLARLGARRTPGHTRTRRRPPVGDPTVCPWP